MSGFDESKLVYTEKGEAWTADVLAFARDDGEWTVLLIERGNDPFKGRMAMPGGFLDHGEEPRAAAARELEEETGLQIDDTRLSWLGRYDTPGRDPRRPTASDVYTVKLDRAGEVQGGDDAAGARFVPVEPLVERIEREGPGNVLAFDHDGIFLDAVERLLS